MTTSISVKLYQRLSLYSYVLGLPYFCHEQPLWLKYTSNIHKVFSKISSIINIFLLFLNDFSFYTQTELNEQQKSDQITFALLNICIYCTPVVLSYYKDDVRKLVRELVVESRATHNDEAVERRMVKKCYLFAGATIGSTVSTIVFYGLDKFIKSHKEGDVFITIITAWPLVEDTSHSASVGRVLIFVTWSYFLLYMCGGFAIALAMSITISHQYIQLQAYFYSLNNIFKEDLSQQDKEKKYEDSLLVGFKQHTKVLSYTKQLSHTCNLVYGSQVCTSMIGLVMNMLTSFTGDRTMSKLTANFMMVITLLIGIGFYMCTIGDITVEASNLTSAMYSSGWENCGRGSSVRIRRLLGVAMAQTQKPLIVKTLFIVPISYASYLSLIKSSYSVFSVLY